MKKHLSILLVLIASGVQSIAQNKIRTREFQNYNVHGPEGKAPSPGLLTEVLMENSPCITEEQQKEMQDAINKNIKRLNRERPGLLNKTTNVHPLFAWPTQAKAGFTGYGYYTVHNLVDHNLNFPNQLLDYNCGHRTYDFGSGNHAGTDIILWPFAWKRMDEQLMEVIAAAPGVIVNKVDGNYDRNCANNGAGSWNAIHVQHADGSIAWYLHFKSGSLTSKGVGDNVVTGEYLGTAGSSGSSDWPHLHFQVMDSTNSVIDPFQGTCNNFNPDSWWINQQPYIVPSINHICTKKTELEYYSCPNPEITYEADTFNIGDSLWIWVYTRDLDSNSTMQINIYNPSGQNVLNFPFTVPWPTYTTTYIRWYYLVDAWFVQGNWTFEAVYNGNTYQHPFYMTHGVAGINENIWNANFTVVPNPSKGQFTLSGCRNGDETKIYDLMGKELHHSTVNENNFKVDVNELARGVYIMQLLGERGTATKKIMIE